MRAATMQCRLRATQTHTERVTRESTGAITGPRRPRSKGFFVPLVIDGLISAVQMTRVSFGGRRRLLKSFLLFTILRVALCHSRAYNVGQFRMKYGDDEVKRALHGGRARDFCRARYIHFIPEICITHLD